MGKWLMQKKRVPSSESQRYLNLDSLAPKPVPFSHLQAETVLLLDWQVTEEFMVRYRLN